MKNNNKINKSRKDMKMENTDKKLAELIFGKNYEPDPQDLLRSDLENEYAKEYFDHLKVTDEEKFKKCNVCDGEFEKQDVIENKDGFVICKSCKEFEEAEFMPEYIV